MTHDYVAIPSENKYSNHLPTSQQKPTTPPVCNLLNKKHSHWSPDTNPRNNNGGRSSQHPASIRLEAHEVAEIQNPSRHQRFPGVILETQPHAPRPLVPRRPPYLGGRGRRARGCLALLPAAQHSRERRRQRPEIEIQASEKEAGGTRILQAG